MQQNNYTSIFPEPHPPPAISILPLPALLPPTPFILILFPLLHIQSLFFETNGLFQFLKLCIAPRLTSSEERGTTAWESSET